MERSIGHIYTKMQFNPYIYIQSKISKILNFFLKIITNFSRIRTFFAVFKSVFDVTADIKQVDGVIIHRIFILWRQNTPHSLTVFIAIEKQR